jgi:hypothetical protein
MSVEVQALIWKHAPYRGNTLIAFLALGDWSDDEGVSWPKMASLAKKSRQSIRNAHYAVELLKRDRFLSIESHRGAGKHNQFRINMQKLHILAGKNVQSATKKYATSNLKICKTEQPNKEEPSGTVNEPSVSQTQRPPRKPEDDVSQPDTDLQVQEIAALHPKIHDPFHLTKEVSSAIAAAVERDGRERVWAGTKSMADAVTKWPKEEMRFLSSAPRFFRESQYRKDPREWERKADGKSVTPKNPPPLPNPADLKRRMLEEMND